MDGHEPQPRTGTQQDLRRRCEALARALSLPDPFDLQRFLAGLAARRGRPIVLLEWEFEGQISGLLIDQRDADYVLVERHTTPLHQRQIAIHELAHLICGHRPQIPFTEAAMHAQGGGLRDDLVRYVLQRGGYRSVEEQEAEILASLIMERIAEQARWRRERPDESGDAAIERVRSTLAGDGVEES